MHGNLNFGQTNIQVKRLHIIKSLAFDVIIGTDSISELIFYKRDGRNHLILNGAPVNLAFQKHTVYNCNTVEIPAKNSRAIDVKCSLPPNSNYMRINTSGVFHRHFDKLLFCETLTETRAPRLTVINTSDYDISLPTNLPIGTAEHHTEHLNALAVVDDFESEKSRHDRFLLERKTKFTPVLEPNVMFGESLTMTERAKIKQVVNSNYRSFSYNKRDTGLIKGFRYELDIKNPNSVWYEPERKVSPAKRAEIEKIFSDEVEDGLLEHAASNFSHGLVLVSKPDGSLRVCSDLRTMNKNLHCLRFPLPRVDALLQSVGRQVSKNKDSKVFMATLDIASAYRCLEVADRDKSKLAFNFSNQSYQHTRMPFGAIDAPATFSLLMRKILADLPQCINYLDDVICVESGLENFISTLDKLFSRLLSFGILLKPSKCKIGVREVNFVGHKITQTGIQITDEKVNALTSLKQPSNKDELRSLLGCFAFQSSSVPNLYVILAPLLRLMKKDIKFQWTTDCAIALTEAKNQVKTAVERVHRDLAKPLVITVDSSGVGTGAVLSQRNGDILEPLEFYSNAFTEGEQKYPTRSRELLGCAKSVKHWATYLVGEHFTILNDHKSLQYLMSTRADELDLKTKNILWFLSHFDFSIAHISGTSDANKIADSLSRACVFKGVKCEETDEFDPQIDDWDLEREMPADLAKINAIRELDLEYHLGKTFSLKELISAQKSDRRILKFRTDNNVAENDLALFKGKLMIPNTFTAPLLQYLHKIRGHESARRLRTYLSQYFSIHNLDGELADLIRSCGQCTKVKPRKKLTPEPQSKFHYVDLPFSKVFVDLVDFGQKDSKGYRYGLTYLCALTRYVDMVPLENKSAETVANGLISLLCRYGVPDHLVSDNGSEFKGICDQMVKELFGVYVSHISPLNPRSNLVERTHREIKMTMQLHNIELDKWSDSIPITLFLVNVKHSPCLNGMSPFEALFLRRPRDPLSVPAVHRKNRKWFHMFPQSRIFTQLALGHQQRFLRKRRPGHVSKFNEGDQVYAFKQPRPGQSLKLFTYWHGPYTVIRGSSPGVYVLENPMTTQRLLRNARLLRPAPKSTPSLVANESSSSEEEEEGDTTKLSTSVGDAPNLNDVSDSDIDIFSDNFENLLESTETAKETQAPPPETNTEQSEVAPPIPSKTVSPPESNKETEPETETEQSQVAPPIPSKTVPPPLPPKRKRKSPKHLADYDVY